MQKVIGAAFVMISGVLFSSVRVLREREQLENVKEVQKALFYMKQEIAFSGKILTRIVNEIASRTKGEVGAFFGGLGEMLKMDETAPLSACFLKAKEGKAFLPDEAMCVLEDFFQSVGTFSGELENLHLDATLTKLAQIEKEARERFFKNKKLKFTLGICASFGAVMILI